MLCCPTVDVLSLRSSFSYREKSPLSARVTLTVCPSSHLEYLGMTRAFFSIAIMCVTIINGQSTVWGESNLLTTTSIIVLRYSEKKSDGIHIWWNLRCTVHQPELFPGIGRGSCWLVLKTTVQIFQDGKHLRIPYI